jgi:hypothetical protein
MTLAWVRLDSAIGMNDKILALIADKTFNETKRWKATTSYMVALGWCGQQETDGNVRREALSFVHGDPKTAEILVKHELWDVTETGWRIHNYGERQQLRATTQARSDASSVAGSIGACARHHVKDCWQNGKCRMIPKPKGLPNVA